MDCRKCGSWNIQRNEKSDWYPLRLVVPLVLCHDCGCQCRVPFWAKMVKPSTLPKAVRKKFKVQRRTDTEVNVK